MLCCNPKIDLVNINAYIKFGEILIKLFSRYRAETKFWRKSRAISDTNVPKMMCKDPKLDLVNWNAYIKFGEILSNGSQDMSGNEILA